MKLRTIFPTFRNVSSLGMICGWASENQIGPVDFRRLLARGPVPKILMWQPVNNRPLCVLISVILCNLNCPLSTESAPRPSAQSSSAPPPTPHAPPPTSPQTPMGAKVTSFLVIPKEPYPFKMSGSFLECSYFSVEICHEMYLPLEGAKDKKILQLPQVL